MVNNGDLDYNNCSILLSIIKRHGRKDILAVSDQLTLHTEKNISVTKQRMDFEREMQKALSVIFQNIQALEDKKVEIPAKFKNDRVTRDKEGQRKLTSLSLSNLRSSSNNYAVGCGSGMNST